jgi:hypothetical protein
MADDQDRRLVDGVTSLHTRRGRGDGSPLLLKQVPTLDC